MGISMRELKELDKSSYQIIDIRDQIEIAHGQIAGAIAIKPEEIESSEK